MSMTVEKKEAVQSGIKRAVFAGLAIVLQILMIYFIYFRLETRFTWIANVITILAVLLVLYIYGSTINLDFRSLYHHFENGAFMYDYQAVRDMKCMFDETFPKCREVTEEYRTGRSSFLRLKQLILRLFAPLM